MPKRRGFIMKELMLYLFLGSLLLLVNLNLFRSAWLTYGTMRRIHQVKGDFLVVSERIKYDLLSNVHEITVGKTSFTFCFTAWTDPRTYVIREYTVQVLNGRLVYNIYNNNSFTATYLSSLVKAIAFTTEEDLLIITFDYGDYQFRRTYRLDHIKTQRFLYSFHSDPLSHLCHGQRDPDHGSLHGFHGQRHILV